MQRSNLGMLKIRRSSERWRGRLCPPMKTSKISREPVKINYRVKSMEEVLSHLKSKGVAIEKTEEYPSMGNFAWLKDPDGNQIELWEPSEEE